MDVVTLIILAVGLSMDAFAVSVSDGILLGKAKPAAVCKIAGAFGLFQGLMPIIGYLIADQFAEKIIAVDHWIAFGLLVFIGGKMLWETLFEKEESASPATDPTAPRTLLLMAVATSIDAMAVGVTMALDRTGLLVSDTGFLLCSAVIALTTFLFCVVGVLLGCKTGSRYGKKAEIAGGIVLIAIGIKILLEHLL